MPAVHDRRGFTARPKDIELIMLCPGEAANIGLEGEGRWWLACRDGRMG